MVYPEDPLNAFGPLSICGLHCNAEFFNLKAGLRPRLDRQTPITPGVLSSRLHMSLNQQHSPAYLIFRVRPLLFFQYETREL